MTCSSVTHHDQYLQGLQNLWGKVDPLTPSTNTSASKYVPRLETHEVLQAPLDGYEWVNESRIYSSGTLSLGPESTRCNPSTAYLDLNHAKVLAYTRWGIGRVCLCRGYNGRMMKCQDVLRDLLAGLPSGNPAKMTRSGSDMAISTLRFVFS